MLAACSGGGNNNSDSNTPPTPQSTTNESGNNSGNNQPEKEPEPEPIVYPDLGGRTISLSAWWPLAPDPETIEGQEQLARIAEVEKNYNVKIEFQEPLAWDEVNQKFIMSVLDGKPFADIIRLQWDWALPAAINGQLQKFGDYYDPNTFKALRPSPLLLGEQYGFQAYDPTDASGIFFNRDIIEQLGLKSPHEYVREGNWTWDTFTELAKAATRDTNNDGVNDYWGLAGWAHDFSIFAVASNGSKIVFEEEAREGLSDPRTMAAYDWMRQLYFDDKVWYAIDTPANYSERENNPFTQGNILFTAGWLWMQDSFNEVNLGFVPFPIGPSGSGFVSSNDAGNTWFIPAFIEDVGNVLRVFDEISVSTIEEDYPGQTNLEGRFNYMEDVEAVRMVNTPDKMVLQYQRAFESSGFPLYDVNHQIFVEKQPVATAVDMYKQQAQAAIDQVMGGAQ